MHLTRHLGQGPTHASKPPPRAQRPARAAPSACSWPSSPHFAVRIGCSPNLPRLVSGATGGEAERIQEEYETSLTCTPGLCSNHGAPLSCRVLPERRPHARPEALVHLPERARGRGKLGKRVMQDRVRSPAPRAGELERGRFGMTMGAGQEWERKSRPTARISAMAEDARPMARTGPPAGLLDSRKESLLYR